MKVNDRQFVMDCKQFLNSNMSIRQFVASSDSNYSRTHFHAQIHERLPLLDKKLYVKICEKLNYNFKHRHSFTQHD